MKKHLKCGSVVLVILALTLMNYKAESQCASNCSYPATFPSAPTLTNITTTSVTVGWPTINNADGYRVYYSLNNGLFLPFGAELGGTIRSVVFTTLAPGSSYRFYVDAINHCIDGECFPDAYTRTSPIASEATVPNAPIIDQMGTTSSNSSTITFKWQSVSADGYYFDLTKSNTFSNYVLQNQDIAGGTTTSYTRNDLDPGTYYYYRLRAYYAGKVSGFSAQSTAIATRPVAPTPNISNVTTNSFNANWESLNGNATTFRFDVSTTSNFSTLLPGYTNVPINALSTNIAGLTAGTDYYFRVRAETTTQNSAYSTSSTRTVTTAPVAIPATNVLSSSIVANWNVTPGAVTYRLDVSSNLAFSTFVSGYDNRTVNGTSQMVTGLLPGTTYYYRVRAVDAGGTSVGSVPMTQLTLPDPPADFRITLAQNSTLALAWNAALSATDYYLEISTSDDFLTLLNTYNPRIISGFTSFVADGLALGTTYYLRIKSKNTAGLSETYSVFTGTTTNDGGSGALVLDNVIYPESFNPAGSPGVISAHVATSSNGLLVNFYHKKKSEDAYTREEITSATTQDIFQISIDPTWVDVFGMDFYFEATDESAVLKRNPLTGYLAISGVVSSFNIPVDEFGKDLKNYRVISFPYQLSKRKIQEIMIPIMHEYDKHNWRFLIYQNGENLDFQDDGLGIEDVKQGQGYWFISKTPVDLTFNNGTSYGNSVQQPFVANFKKGWNQVGNPYPYDLHWMDVQNANNSLGNLLVYDAANVAFKEANDLPAYSGGFVFCENDQTITFPIIAGSLNGGRVAGGGRSKGSDVKSGEQNYDGWKLPITIRQGEVFNRLSGVGMVTGALASKDTHDKVIAPRFMRFAEMRSSRNELDYPLAFDVVNKQEFFMWNFRVESDSGSPALLEWDAEAATMVGGTLIMFDRKRKALINMANLSSYTVDNATSLSIHFKSNASADFASVFLGSPYPNPFTSSFKIPFAFEGSETSPAHLRIVDSAGILVVDETLEPVREKSGATYVKWPGPLSKTEADGLAPGEYFFRLQTTLDGIPTRYSGRIIKE